MTGIIALYIFMLAAFTGYEVISRMLEMFKSSGARAGKSKGAH
jgi:hypothetical protein